MIPDDESAVSAMIGKAGHFALETIFGGNDKVPVPPDVDAAAPYGIEAGLQYLDSWPDESINYGASSDREKMLQTYSRAIQWYIDEMPRDWDVVSVEEKMQHHLKRSDGTALAIPMKGKLDLLVRKPNGRLQIIDHKFVRSYTDPDVEDAKKIIQCMFLYHLVEAEHGEAPEDIIFRECKVSENRDGTVQTKEWGVRYQDVPHYFTTFMRLYDDCTKALIRKDVLFLPNIMDPMRGNESFLLYQQNLLDVDMSDVEVDHNTHHVRYMPKQSHYSESTLDTADASAFLPEERVRIKLAEFGIPVKAQEVHHGPCVTLYTFAPSRGVSVKRVEKHAQDIALALRAQSIRLLPQIPGTNLIGIEVPREDREIIQLREEHFTPGTFEVPIGVDLYGEVVKKDLTKMPHLLVAGATGSGKSVFMNVVIDALTKQKSPQQMRMILIDPKQVELSDWESDPHTDGPVITTVSESVRKLDALVKEMNDRYAKLRAAGVNSISKYGGDMPYLLVVIDEFADLIMSREKIKTRDIVSGENVDKVVVGSEIENSVVRLAQKGRAAGIHLMIGTQRPDRNVVTGLIKANFPTRVAFMTSSATDSRVILDTKGAEELLGEGDMLYMDPSSKGLQRLQGFFLK